MPPVEIDTKQPEDRRTSLLTDLDRRVLSLEHRVATIEKIAEKTDTQFSKIIERLEKMQIVEERIVRQGEEVKRAFEDISKAREIAEKTQSEFREYVSKIEGMKKIAWFAWSVMGSAVAGCAVLVGWMLQYYGDK
jgi:methyl-accepting chemotaxis protein